MDTNKMINVIAFWDEPTLYPSKRFLIEIDNQVLFLKMKISRDPLYHYLQFDGFYAFRAHIDIMSEISSGKYDEFFSNYYHNNNPYDYIFEFNSYYFDNKNIGLDFAIRFQNVFEVKLALDYMKKEYENSTVLSFYVPNPSQICDLSMLNYHSSINRYDALEYQEIHLIVDNDKAKQTTCQLELMGYSLHTFNY